MEKFLQIYWKQANSININLWKSVCLQRFYLYVVQKICKSTKICNVAKVYNKIRIIFKFCVHLVEYLVSHGK